MFFSIPFNCRKEPELHWKSVFLFENGHLLPGDVPPAGCLFLQNSISTFLLPPQNGAQIQIPRVKNNLVASFILIGSIHWLKTMFFFHTLPWHTGSEVQTPVSGVSLILRCGLVSLGSRHRSRVLCEHTLQQTIHHAVSQGCTYLTSSQRNDRDKQFCMTFSRLRRY